MKMDRQYQSTLRTQRISILLTELGLINCCSEKLSKLSCGERKRISLAVQVNDFTFYFSLVCYMYVKSYH
jgi:ABC-type multidrug transport system ATPase subunit